MTAACHPRLLKGPATPSVPEAQGSNDSAPCSFWDRTASPRPLAWFRIGLSSVLVVQALAQVGHLDDLYGRHGIVAWSVISEDMPAAVPNLAWLHTALGFMGLPGNAAVPLAFSLYVGGLVGLLLGCRTRLAALLAWIIHTALLTSGDLSMYGVDRFAQIGLFYCCWLPVANALSFDRAAGRVRGEPSFEAWIGLLVLQVHVCILYTASGVEKALGQQWWNGEAIWRALMGMHQGPMDFSFLATVSGIAPTLCWLTLLLEAGVLGFVWHPRLRTVWLVGIVGMHLSIALLMNLWTFSATMIVFDIAAFGFRPRSNCHLEAESTFRFEASVAA